MNKAKKVLSFLLALVMLSSVFSVAVYAKAPYLDGSLPESQYDDREIPHLTTNQLASVVCDFLDDILEEQGIYEDLSILGSLDLRSLDTAYRDIYSLIGTATGIGAGLVGDLKNLKRAPLKDKRRTNSPAATADLEMLRALLNFLGEPDNANIIKKLIQGNLNMGIIKNYFTLDLDVNYMIKEALFKEAYKDTPVPKPISNTIDQMVEDLIAGFLVGTEEEPGFAPGLAPYINIATSNKPVYDFIEDLLQNAYNEVVVPLLNNELKEAIRGLCGVVEDDESNLNDFANIFNIDYVVPAHNFPAGPSFVSELNNIAYEVVSAMIKGFNSWQPGGPEKVLANATAVAKFVMKNAGEAIFIDYVYFPAKTDAEIDAMTSQQIFAYILRLTLNQLVEYMYIPEDADSLTKILWYAVKELNDHNIPGVDYTNVPKTADGALDMLGDYIVYELNKKIDMNSTKGSKPGQGLLPYGLGFDGTLLAIVNYAMDNYGGLLSLTLSKTNVWAALNTLVFAVINSNWLPASVGGDLHELIINRVVKDALALNVENIFALLDRNPTSEFATSTIRQIIVKTVAKMLNLVFPGALNESYASLEVAFSNNELGNIVDRLLKQLKARQNDILPAALPLLSDIAGLTIPQKFKAPSLGIPTQISTNTTFKIENESEGLNTAHRDKNGIHSQDSLYKIRIVSLTSSIPAINISNLAGTVINGGDSVDATVSGTFGNDQVLVVTMKYDVLTELGEKLTDEPLTVVGYSYISNVMDDGQNWTKIDHGKNNKLEAYYKSFYFNQDSGVGAINATNVQLVRREATGHLQSAKFKRTAASLPAELTSAGIRMASWTDISTGNEDSWHYPQLLETDEESYTRPADGRYTPTLTYSGEATIVFGSAVSWNYQNKTFFTFYDDHGLPAFFRNELNRRRNAADYGVTEWNNYIVAMKNAASLVYRPRQASIFYNQIVPNFEPYLENLENAIEALEESSVGASVDSLKVLMDQVRPSNEGLDRFDEEYQFYGVGDYATHTYENFLREYYRAEGMWKSQQIDEDSEEPQELPIINPVDVAMARHRLELYASRLVRVAPDKTKLAQKLAMVGNPVEGQYTEASWAAFKKSYDFAVAVNAESATATDANGDPILRQSKIDTARYHLVSDFKRLVLSADYSQLRALIAQVGTLDEENYTPESWADLVDALQAALDIPLNMSMHPDNQALIDAAAAALEQAIALLELAGEILEAILDGDGNPQAVVDLANKFVYGLGEFNPAEGNVQAGQGYIATFHENDGGGYGTGATIELSKEGHESVFYTVIVFGDMDGNGAIDATDEGIVVDYENYITDLDEEFYLLAADTDNSGSLDVSDAALIVDHANYVAEIDQISPRMIY